VLAAWNAIIACWRPGSSCTACSVSLCSRPPRMRRSCEDWFRGIRGRRVGHVSSRYRRRRFSQAHKRLGPEPLCALHSRVAVALTDPQVAGDFYRSRQLMSIDGLCLDVADTAANVERLGWPRVNGQGGGCVRGSTPPPRSPGGSRGPLSAHQTKAPLERNPRVTKHLTPTSGSRMSG
jgi:hypothetical protein